MSEQGYFQPAIQTQAAWDADDAVYGKFTLMLVSDGANSNKFKLADGESTFAELDYFTSGGGGDLTADQIAAIEAATPDPDASNEFLTRTSAINETTGSNPDIDDAISDAVAPHRNWLNGVSQSGTYTFTGLAGETGELVVNLVTATPAMASAYLIGGSSTAGPAVPLVFSGTLAAYTVVFFDTDGQVVGEGTPVSFTVGGTLA